MIYDGFNRCLERGRVNNGQRIAIETLILIFATDI